MTPPDRDALERVMADALWCGERRREITEYWRNTGGYEACVLRVRAQLAALEAAGCVVMPSQATEEMVKAGAHAVNPRFDWLYVHAQWAAMVGASPFRSRT